MRKCHLCGKDVSKVALTQLVYTWEPIDDELHEVTWHKECFIRAQAEEKAQETKKKLAEAMDLDAEAGHLQADIALCDLLSALGFDDVVAAYDKVQKWYS